MEPTERCAYAGASAIALLAVAGFFCIVFLPADATISHWLSADESIAASLAAHSRMAQALSAGGAFR